MCSGLLIISSVSAPSVPSWTTYFSLPYFRVLSAVPFSPNSSSWVMFYFVLCMEGEFTIPRFHVFSEGPYRRKTRDNLSTSYFQIGLCLCGSAEVCHSNEDIHGLKGNMDKLRQERVSKCLPISQKQCRMNTWWVSVDWTWSGSTPNLDWTWSGSAPNFRSKYTNICLMPPALSETGWWGDKR